MSVLNCSICIDSLASPPLDVTATRCGHVFHAACLAKWSSAGHVDCPQCRAGVAKDTLVKLYLADGPSSPLVDAKNKRAVEGAASCTSLQPSPSAPWTSQGDDFVIQARNTTLYLALINSSLNTFDVDP